MKRRDFIQFIGGLTASSLLFGTTACSPIQARKQAPGISLAQWSLHRTIRSGRLAVLDFPRITREWFGIHAVEYVNQFFADKAQDRHFLAQLKLRADDAGVRSLLIMIDGEGDLAATESRLQQQAIENHYPWVEAANALGCHSIRVSIGDSGTDKAAAGQAAVLGLSKLADFATDFGVDIIVENHMGHSMDAVWLAEVLRQVERQNIGSLPDFGNFDGDLYQGTELLLPFARGISAKSFAFNQDGTESSIDYFRLMQSIKDAGYQGYIGIEYEGDDSDEVAGIQKTQHLLERAIQKLWSRAEIA